MPQYSAVALIPSVAIARPIWDVYSPNGSFSLVDLFIEYTNGGSSHSIGLGRAQASSQVLPQPFMCEDDESAAPSQAKYGTVWTVLPALTQAGYFRRHHPLTGNNMQLIYSFPRGLVSNKNSSIFLNNIGSSFSVTGVRVTGRIAE